MLPNQRRRHWCYLLSVDFTALYGYHKSLGYVYLYRYICISDLAAAILDFPMHYITNNKNISTGSRQSRETELWLANYSWLIVYHQNGTRFCFPVAILDLQLKTTSGDIAHNTAESGICENMSRPITVAISLLAHLYADIKVFPVWWPPCWICGWRTTSSDVAYSTVESETPGKHRYSRWNFVASSLLWDKCTSGLAAAILDLQRI